MEPNLVQVSGLAFDVIGAFLVVSALVFEKARVVKAQSLTVLNGNPALHLALLRQGQDALFGLIFLVTGFGLLIFAAFGVVATLSWWYMPFAAILIGLLIYAIKRRRLNKSELAQRAKRMMEKNAAHLS